MAKRRAIEPSQLGRRRRRRRNLKLLLFTILILLIFGGLVFASHLSQVAISDIKIEGNSFVSSDEIASKTKDDLSGSYFHLFPKNNTFIYPKRQIELELLQALPSIKSLSIERTDLTGIKIVLNERKPASLWCGDSACYFMDETGFIFQQAADFSTDLYFIYYGLVSPENPIGHYYLPEDQFTAINDFLNDIKKLNIQATSLTAVDQSDFQLNLASRGQIRFSLNQPLSQTLSNLETVIDKNNSAGTSVDLSQIDYLDLRFGNKVFYKLKGGTAATSTL